MLSAGRPSSRSKKNITLSSLSDDSEEMKRVNFDLSLSRHKKLKMYAIQSGKSIKEVLTSLIDDLPD